MTLLYVSGPVVSTGAAGVWQREQSASVRIGELSAVTVYEWVKSVCDERGVDVLLPVREPALDALRSRDFVKAITDRIRFADLVLRVFAADDKSGPIEAAIACMLKKKQLIVAPYPLEVPRLQRGLEGVVGVVTLTNEAAFRLELRSFLYKAAPVALAAAGGVY